MIDRTESKAAMFDLRQALRVSNCDSRADEAVAQMIEALKVARDYATFMAHHQQTDLGIPSNPPLKTIQAALKAAGIQ